MTKTVQLTERELRVLIYMLAQQINGPTIMGILDKLTDALGNLNEVRDYRRRLIREMLQQ